MKRNQFIICFLSIFFVSFLYASPAKELEYLNSSDQEKIQNSCLLTTFKEKLENNDQWDQFLNTNDILNYECSVGVEPTVAITSINNWNIMSDDRIVSYPEVNLKKENSAENKSIVIVTSIF